MSNLWFFRLNKRAEQQRRRSSGDSRQSFGSVQSAGSGAQLQASGERQAPHQGQHLHLHQQAASGSSASQQYQAHSSSRQRQWQPSADSSDDERDSNDSGDQQLRNANQSCTDASQQQHQRHHSLLSSRQRSNRLKRRPPRPAVDSMAGTTCGAGALPLPQVTIVRTDSVSSVGSPLLAGQQQQQQQQGAELAAVLDAPSGQVRASVVATANTIQGNNNSNNNNTTRVEDTAKRGIHSQLIEGKVPPIQENLLNAPGRLSVADSIDNLAALIPRVRVEFYNSENTLKERLQMYFIKDHTVSLYIRCAKLILNVLACYLYVVRVILDRGPMSANCYGCEPRFSNTSTVIQGAATQSLSKFDPAYDGPINFRAFFWVDRGPNIWTCQTMIAVICFMEALLMQYLTFKNNIFSIISFHFTLEVVTNIPFIVSIFWKELRTLFVPSFLSSWLAKQCLEGMLNDLSIVRQSSVFSHRLTILSATLFCLIFTSACGFQHAQRAGGRNVNIFESIYFVVVTLSTVGYGDFKPETWPSQLFIMVMICVALMVLPSQFEQLAYFWIERKKLGASYAHHSTQHEKHVVVCSTTLRADTIMDFLNEFYAQPLLQTFSVVLLSPCELDTTMKLVLQTPTWNNRVIYIQGSALRASDLIRARMQSAEACFILAARNYNDRSAADEHTILRSWAIRDFGPYVPQYVQIFRTENKIHVAFAEHVVCDDEFKYALLANNCLCPGVSTLVTLLLHTTQQQQHKRRRRKKKNNSEGFFSYINIFCQQQQRRRRLNKRLSSSTAAAVAAAVAAATSDPSKQTDKLFASNGSNDNNNNDDDDDDNDDDDDDDGSSLSFQWKRLYGKCSANEIYHIRLSDSRFFGEYQGKSFTYASFHSHRKFGVALIGVQTDMRGTWPIMLNPGPSYVLKTSDILFYINITKEENSTLMPMIQCQPQPLCEAKLAAEAAARKLNQLPSSPDPFSTQKQQQHDESQQISFSAERKQTQSLGSQEAEPDETVVPQPKLIKPELSNVKKPTELSAPVESTSSSPAVLSSPMSLAPKQHHHHKIHLAPQKHSVADGAGLVARSLCSVAGFGNLAEPSACVLQPQDTQHDPELDHPLSNLPCLNVKRASSASTEGNALISRGAKLEPKNASTLELATLAAGLRKGSNISIASTKSRDISPARLKQVVSGLAVKMRRVKIGKSLTHLTIPRLDYGSSTSTTESFVHARGRRPSIAPVPAMMGESEDHDSDHDREQESYFSTSWHSSSESSPIVKGFPPCTTYIGVSPTLCYLLQKKKPSCCLQLIQACEHCPFKNARQYNWPNRCIILASDFASNGIYNFIVPLRAHFHNPNELRPIVLLLERKPTPQFIDAIAWFPMVYWMPGLIDSLDDLIKAGINHAHSVVVTNKESTNSAEEDYLADCNTIVAVQSMFKMFPSVGIITELSQSSNMRFMQFRAHDVLFGSLNMAKFFDQNPSLQQQFALSGIGGGDPDDERKSQIGSQNKSALDRTQLRKIQSRYYNKCKDVNTHAYKYRLPFAAGNVFSASMLDTLLYQAFVKDYMITMVRLLLGIDQAPGSGFLSSMKITKEELWIRTYGRLYQRLCSTTCEIPLGIYRTEPLDSQRSESFSFGAFASQQASYEHATEELERMEITNMVKNRLQDLGMLVSDYDDSSEGRNKTFSYVIINPNCDVQLREGDIITRRQISQSQTKMLDSNSNKQYPISNNSYLIRPSPIHSRKLFMHRASSVRHSEMRSSPHPQMPQFVAAAASTSSLQTTPSINNSNTKPPLHSTSKHNCATADAIYKKAPSSTQKSLAGCGKSGSTTTLKDANINAEIKLASPQVDNNTDALADETLHSDDQKSNVSKLPTTPSGVVNIKSCASDGDLQMAASENSPRRDSCHILIQVHDSADEPSNIADEGSNAADT